MGSWTWYQAAVQAASTLRARTENSVGNPFWLTRPKRATTARPGAA
jgi:hypothetical protein